MTIVIYRSPTKYQAIKFPKEELDKVREMCYDMGIKYYILIY